MRSTWITLSASLIATVPFESALANTMNALLDGAALAVGPSSESSYTIHLGGDSRYRASGALTGAWRVDGKALWFKRDSESNKGGRGGRESCGCLPSGKKLGDSRSMPSSSGDRIVLRIVKSSK